MEEKREGKGGKGRGKGEAEAASSEEGQTERNRWKESQRSTYIDRKGEIGGGQSLSLKGSGHPGDWEGQQNYNNNAIGLK